MRYSFRERIVHFVVAASFLYLVLTGLAFWSPSFYWIGTMLGGGFQVRALHPWVGLILAAAVTVMFVSWHRMMRITPADREWRRSMGHYIRNEDHLVPPVPGRFNYGQKLLFWTMAVAALMLLVSGLVLWVPQYIPGSLAWIRQFGTLLHATSALVGMGALIVHVYMGVVVVRGGVNAMFQGSASNRRPIGDPDAAIRH